MQRWICAQISIRSIWHEETMMKAKFDHTANLAVASASLALLWACAGLDNALAASPFDSPTTQTLNVKGLDLSRPNDVAVLYSRIVAASVNVCKPWNAGSTGVKVTWDACRDATVSHTVKSLNVASLTSYYMAKIGGQDRKTELVASAR